MLVNAYRLFKRQVCLLFLLFFTGWMITPYSSHFIGISIGLMVSVYCLWILKSRIERFCQYVLVRKRTISLGMINRIAVVILGAMFMYELGHHLVMWTFATGILLGYFLFIVNIGYYNNNTSV